MLSEDAQALVARFLYSCLSPNLILLAVYKILHDPDITTDPDITSHPDVTPDPNITSHPDITPDPHNTTDPNITPDPNITSHSDITPDPNITSTPSTLLINDFGFDGFQDVDQCMGKAVHLANVMFEKTGTSVDKSPEMVYDTLCQFRTKLQNHPEKADIILATASATALEYARLFRSTPVRVNLSFCPSLKVMLGGLLFLWGVQKIVCLNAPWMLGGFVLLWGVSKMSCNIQTRSDNDETRTSPRRRQQDYDNEETSPRHQDDEIGTSFIRRRNRGGDYVL